MCAFLVLLLLVLPATAQPQFTWTTNSDGASVTITGYTGPGGAVIIPNSINNLLVTVIGESAFEPGSPELGTNITSVTIPPSVSSIEDFAFEVCESLTTLAIPASVTNIGQAAFNLCGSLTNVFFNGNGPSMQFAAFGECQKLSGAYFYGNAPDVVSVLDAFYLRSLATDATLYYLPGTFGWDFGEALTERGYAAPALWTLPYPVILNNSVGLGSNGLGFTVSWATNAGVVVEVCTNLVNPVWQALQTNTLTARTNGGFFNFSEPQWSNYPARFYRVQPQ